VPLRGKLAARLAKAGEVARRLDTVEQAIARSDETEERWVMRSCCASRTNFCCCGARPETRRQQNYFWKAFDWARRHGASSWELRASASLARHLCGQGCFTDALALLRPVCDRFTERFDTADLKSAAVLLGTLG
jgi:predicted ATPase